jgi:hypothetical protein
VPPAHLGGGCSASPAIRRPSDPPPIAPWANAGTAAAAAKLKSTAHLRSFGLDIPKINEPLAAGPAECDAAKRRGSYAEAAAGVPRTELSVRWYSPGAMPGSQILLEDRDG